MVLEEAVMWGDAIKSLQKTPFVWRQGNAGPFSSSPFKTGSHPPNYYKAEILINRIRIKKDLT